MVVKKATSSASQAPFPFLDHERHDSFCTEGTCREDDIKVCSAQFSMRTSEQESGSTPSVLGEWAGFQMSMLRIVTCWQSNGCTVQNGCNEGKSTRSLV